MPSGMIRNKPILIKKHWGIGLFFAVYLALGLLLVRDYGCGPDEGKERQTALVNYRYALEKLNLPIDERNRTWMAYLPELKTYQDRFYGTALHFPLVLIESTVHFTLEPAVFYGMRHVYNFLNFYAAVFCFYLLLRDRFKSRAAGLAGCVMLILTPRIFAESFYNNKDVLFISWYIFTTFFMCRWLRSPDKKYSILLALSLALTCNTRFNGIVFIPIFILINLLLIMVNKEPARGQLQRMTVTLLLAGILFYLVTPNFWETPLQTLVETFTFNAKFPNQSAEQNLFHGILVNASKTLTYIPTWILITVPSVYLLFALCGTLIFVKRLFTGQQKVELRDGFYFDLIFFISGYLALAFIIGMQVTIYNGWRHCYFCLPCMLYFGIYAFTAFTGRVRITAKVLLGISLLYNAGWIAANHPYEFAYFSPFFRDAAAQFSGDYWGIGAKAMLDSITENDPERMIRINHLYTVAGSINRGNIPEDKRKYIELTYEQSEDVDYYIVSRDEKTSTDIGLQDYEKVFSIIVDRDEIGTVYKKR